MVPQVHPCVGLAHPEHTLDVSDGDGDATDDIGLASDVRVEVGHLVTVDLVQFRRAVPLGVNYVLAEELLLKRHSRILHHCQRRIFQHILSQMLANLLILLRLVLVDLAHGVTLHVGVDNEGCELIIDLLFYLVTNDCEDIETRQDWVSQIHIIVEVELRLVNTANWVSCRND